MVLFPNRNVMYLPTGLVVPEMVFGAFSVQEHLRGAKSRPSTPCSGTAQGAASHGLSQLELRGLRYATKMHNQL